MAKIRTQGLARAQAWTRTEREGNGKDKSNSFTQNGKLVETIGELRTLIDWTGVLQLWQMGTSIG